MNISEPKDKMITQKLNKVEDMQHCSAYEADLRIDIENSLDIQWR